MAMRTHLTDLAVRSLKTEKPQENVWDTQTKGFGVRISGSTKSWIVRTGQNRSLKTIGRYPAMSLSEARKAALRLLIEPNNDVTPNRSLAEAFTEYLDTHSLTHHGSRTRHETTRLFKTYVLDRIGHKKLSELNFRLLEGIVSVDRPSEANHLFRSLRAFLNWCVRKEYLSANPLAGKPQPAKEVSRDRLLSNQELVRLWHTAEGQYGTIWKLLLLTGQRRAQIVALEWEWVKGDTIEFPASIMKSSKPHIIPIGNLARQLLPEPSGRYVFPSSKGGHTKNLHIDKGPHDERAKVEPYTIHDLRRAFAALHAQAGTPIHLIEKLLAHTSGTFGGIVGVYQRYSYDRELREAVQAYETHISSLLSTGG